MNVPFNPADDFPAVIDGVETVQLRRLRGATDTVDGALKRSCAARAYPQSGGRVVAAEARWHLPVSLLDEPPSIGDRIVDGAGTVWTILEVHHEGAGRWLCHGRGLGVIHGLQQRIAIERAQWRQDAAGAAVATWHLWRAAVVAQIQPVAARVSQAEGRVHLLATHRVLLVEPVPIDENCRIVGPDGQIYWILVHLPAADLDSLDVLEVCDFEPPQPESQT